LGDRPEHLSSNPSKPLSAAYIPYLTGHLSLEFRARSVLPLVCERGGLGIKRVVKLGEHHFSFKDLLNSHPNPSDKSSDVHHKMSKDLPLSLLDEARSVYHIGSLHVHTGGHGKTVRHTVIRSKNVYMLLYSNVDFYIGRLLCYSGQQAMFPYAERKHDSLCLTLAHTPFKGKYLQSYICSVLPPVRCRNAEVPSLAPRPFWNLQTPQERLSDTSDV
jgi:hypothetical protein